MLPSNTKNISIEFFKPRRNSLGKRVKDEMNANINAETFKNITPFAITSHKYSPSTLEWADFEKIYQAILTYLKTMTYNDPLAETSKSANTKTKIATSKKSMYAVPQNISYRNGKYPEAATILTYGADAVPESINRNNTQNNNNMNKNRIRLTESQLHRVIKESVRNVLKESSSDECSYYLGQIQQAIKEIDVATQGLIEMGLGQGNTPNDEYVRHLLQFVKDFRR